MSSPKMTPAQALERARRLTSAAVDPRSTAQERRKFHDFLITLPSYPGYDCKAYFGTLVARFFAEFEDLQDKAVDVLLDLCEDEDEKTRMIGIKGLGATGKAAPRWVKGNTGVLLQLLDTPPKELELVHQAVGILLFVQPSEVLTVMSEVCRDPEEETGASRRKILEYLNKEGSTFRQQVLGSSKDLEAENAFREGFIKVLKVAGSIETKMISEMMMGLTTISGKNATEQSTGGFTLSLIKSLPRDSSTSSTLPLLRMFSDFLYTAPPLDPRYPLLFMEHHGLAVLGLAMEKRDQLAKRTMEKLARWTKDATGRWKGKGGANEESKELSEAVLVPELSKVLLEGVLTQNRDGSVHETLGHAASSVEAALYCLYSLLDLNDRRRDLVSSKQSRSLSNLCQDADRAERRAKIGTVEQRILLNIRDLTEVLGDYRLPLKRIEPSWEVSSGRPAAVSPPRRTEVKPSLPTLPRGPRSSIPSEPSRDRHNQENDSLSSTGIRKLDHADARIQPPQESTRVHPIVRPPPAPLPDTKPPSPSKPPPAHLTIRRQELPHLAAPQPTLSRIHPTGIHPPPPAAQAGDTKAAPASSIAQNPTPPLPINGSHGREMLLPEGSSHIGKELLPSTNSDPKQAASSSIPKQPENSSTPKQTANSSIPKRIATELMPTAIPPSRPARESLPSSILASTTSRPSPSGVSSSGSSLASRKQELLPPGVTSTVTQEPVKAAVRQEIWSQQVGMSSRSLADRLGATSSSDSPPGTLKRPRMEETSDSSAAHPVPSDLSRPSLLDRLDSREGVAASKRSKLDPTEANLVPRSLLSRLSGQEASSASPGQMTPPPASNLSILSASRRRPPPNPDSLPDRPTPLAIQPPSTPGSFGIRGASVTNGVSIKGQAPPFADRETGTNDGQVKRKGRGFRQDDDGDAIMTAPPASPVVARDYEPPPLLRRISSKGGPRR